jgi:hypothetical protein
MTAPAVAFATRARYAHPKWGFPQDRDLAAARLVPGRVYDITGVHVGDSRTGLWLAAADNPANGFNSVLFDPAVPGDEDEDAPATDAAAEAAVDAARILAGYCATAVTRQVVAYAAAAGLSPAAERDRPGVRYQVVLDGRGPGAMFGVIYVSAKRGVILRAFLVHGAGDERRYDGVAAVRQVIKAYRDARLAVPR